MADEEELESEEAPDGSKKKLILIIAAALLLVGITIGGTLFFVGGGTEPEVATEAEAEEEVVEKGDPVYVDLKPPFTVNLSPEDEVGFLQVSIHVLTYDDAVADDLVKHKPLIRNNLVVLFGQQKSIDLRVPEGKTKLQKSALETIQNVITQYGSGGAVDNVFFTTFVMQ